jgi:hypothetical protein
MKYKDDPNWWIQPEKVLKQDDLAGMTGTTLYSSTHSSWSPPNSGLAQFVVTVMQMRIQKLVTMPQALPMYPMIVTEFLLPLWEAYRVFFVSLDVSSGFIRGGSVTEACH